MVRKILHLDLDAFFCAVEELSDPTLRGKAFAVGGSADQRGVVASCSYAARQFGVHSAMPMGRALSLCPELIIVKARHGSYSDVSRQVMDLLAVSPLVEKISIDEAFVDVTGNQEPIEAIATFLQRRINTEMHLPISIGGATNKLVAKIANNWGKSQKRSNQPPNAITIINPGEEASFLAPQPVQALWGVGPKTAERLASVGITTIGALALTPVSTLESLLGRFGPDLQKRAQGIDQRPVESQSEVKSVSNEVTFSRDLVDPHQLRSAFRQLSEEVGYRLRQDKLAGTTVQIKLRWSDFTTITRQTTLPSATNLDQEIYRTALSLFETSWPEGKPVRLIGVGVTGLGPPARQLSLWSDTSDKDTHLLNALDALRERFGEQIIQRADSLNKRKTNKKQD